MKIASLPVFFGSKCVRSTFAASVAVAALLLTPALLNRAGAQDAAAMEAAGMPVSAPAMTPPALLDISDAAFLRPIASLLALALPPSLEVQLPVAVMTDAAADERLVTASLSTAPFPAPEGRDQPLPTAYTTLALPLPDLSPPADERDVAREPAQPSVAGVPPEDLASVRAALVEYRKGNLPAGDALAAKLTDDAARLSLEWAAIRNAKQRAGFRRLNGFAVANPAFPMAEWVFRRAEEALFVEKPAKQAVLDFFRQRQPEMAHGKVALARVFKADGNEGQANALVRSAWRDNQSSQSLRAAILKEFPGAISTADHRHLAERLIYEGQTSEGLRVASAAGPATVAVLQVLAASINENGGAPALIAKLDPALMNDPAVMFSQIQALRRADKIAEAGQKMLRAPTDLDRVVDGDEWWMERRLLSRKLLDSGDAEAAYKVAAGHAAESSANRVDAETQAGWIALRFLNKPERAAEHFSAARMAAQTPTSIARAAYWQGRAAEAMDDPMRDLFYLGAAGRKHTFYGQLAIARLRDRHRAAAEPTVDVTAVESSTQSGSLRAIRVLLDVDAKDMAQPLITEAAQRAGTLAEVAALGNLVARYGLPRLTLLAGKLAMQRGLASEDHAFPTFGIPAFESSPTSAEPAIVYSIARQESEFDSKAVSHAGARGLMQLMPATARRAALNAKLPFDVNQLTANPALNARIGAAHLGELFGEYNGSYLLSFAAYNAGGKRVKEWTTAYGDPRDPAVDKVDWIERIPITETRHYVQKILENLQVYRARLTTDKKLGIAADMERGVRRPKSVIASAQP